VAVDGAEGNKGRGAVNVKRCAPVEVVHHSHKN
jgi:hypothetical protein